MPTGYTWPVAEGKVTDLRPFALDCARNFMACITLRDEPGGGDRIPDEFAPSRYNAESATKGRDRLAAVRAMTDAECDAEAEKEYRAKVETRRDSNERYAVEDARMRALLADAKRWTPPTPEHAGLKSFMVQQLTDSLHGDMTPYMGAAPVRLSAAGWRDVTVSMLRESIARDDAEQAEEDKRAATRTAWVKALRASLPQDATKS